MPQLTLADIERIKEIIDTKFDEPFIDVATLVMNLKANGGLAEFYAIILRPLWWATWWNKILMIAHRKRYVIDLMTLPQLAEVASDFFVGNVNWISAYLSFTTNSNSMPKTIPLVGERLRIENPLYQSTEAQSATP